MQNKSRRIEKCIISRTGTESLVKQGRRPGSQTPDARATAGTDTLITTAARNGGEDMVEWVRGGDEM